ncbi:glucan 1,3-beta-glucosidase-like [Papaver somniferum]|uniref:glucan 1,3-beta-glucosidase-like n=1 Tax=Papaver somniferum TaxID=3469 RepID=UPI000E6F7E78|nr:glucan 1,3-beta-glucosidase-like [Papaver somniferum]XP_026391105.1 glucan 1,3-beta-glucosidase-like [Papaver somniferum]
MESVSCKWLLLSILFLSWAHSALSVDGLSNGDTKVKGVNLGGWLVIEGFITPSLFNNIVRADMLDGAKVRFKSLKSYKYVSAKDGGGSSVAIDQTKADTWETFRLWRISATEYQFRTYDGHFLSCDGKGAPVTAKSSYPPSSTETFTVDRSDHDKVRIRHSSGSYLQASPGNVLKADYIGIPGWDDGNAAIFEMTFDGSNMRGDYQLSNGYGYQEAKKVLDEHRSSFITEQDFQFLSSQGINTVRIPVGWWIKDDSNPEPPYIGGSAAYLQMAFEWAEKYNIKCIIGLHASRGSQNGMEHSASRDGTIDWHKYNDNVQESLKAIDFLASNYGKHPALLGIELLNEPIVPQNSLYEVLIPYYSKGYKIVRKYSDRAYVLISQRINARNLYEIYDANELKNLPKLVVDFHFYNLYIELFWNKSPSENIQYIKNERRRDVESLNARNGPLVFVGEWVNTFGRGDPGTRMELQDYSKAQLEVYGSASFGWAYWTLKHETAPRWDFKKNIKNKIMQLQ